MHHYIASYSYNSYAVMGVNLPYNLAMGRVSGGFSYWPVLSFRTSAFFSLSSIYMCSQSSFIKSQFRGSEKWSYILGIYKNNTVSQGEYK